METTILIAGDFCSHDRSANLDIIKFQELFTDVSSIINEVDYSIVNLETPLSIKYPLYPLLKQGPSLINNMEVANVLQTIGFNAVTMANNHILDYGEAVLVDTINAVKNINLDFVGVGENLTEASKPLVKMINKFKVAFINCCEHEFSVAGNSSAGAHPLNPIIQYYQIQELKKKVDFVIMIIHGGIEHLQYPTKRMVETYRFFVDAGADAVINHHQHCPCGYEIYKNKPIYYGIGNFFFDWDGKRNSIWNLGYMVRLSLQNNLQLFSEIIPYRQCDKDPSVLLLKEKESENFDLMMKMLCEVIQDPVLLEQKFKNFNSINDYLYRKMLEPYSGRLANGLYRRGFLPTTISKERILALMDFIICESHYERVKEYLERLYKKYCNE